MRVLIATDAWHPQVNGVVRTLTSLAEAAKPLIDVDCGRRWCMTGISWPSCPIDVMDF